MSSSVEHGKNKMISSYGGIGSILEAIDNSIIVETFDNWGYSEIYNTERFADFIIQDDRLLSLLRSHFTNLKHLVKIPDFNIHDHNAVVRPKANYFPKWFFCPRCSEFNEYNGWKNKWVSSGEKLTDFYPPKCHNKKCRNSELEQIRFVLTCSEGHIDDLPWKFWTTRSKDDTSDIVEDDHNQSNNESDIKSSVRLDFTNPNGCCDNPDLRYKISRENAELSGIFVECKHCEKYRTLKGIFGYEKKCSGKKHWISPNSFEKCDSIASVKIKSSNSVYYSQARSSLYVPLKQHSEIPNNIRIAIDNLKNNNTPHSEIAKMVNMMFKIPEIQILSYLETGNDHNLPEILYREQEYNFLLGSENENYQSKHLKFNKIEVSETIEGISTIIRIDKLKQTSVQAYFTRQEPIDVDSILLNEDDFSQIDYTVKRQSTSKNSINTTILPAVESYGEGILFVLNKNNLDSWCSNQDVINRAHRIRSRASESDRRFIRKKADIISPKFILIHSLAHLLIKELEYVCGYPAASLRERLYVSDNMSGFLILAIEGTEGSLGGLVSLCDDVNKLNILIKSALNRAKDCSSDPVCYHSEGQGVNNLNLAACHSCLLLPETSCEEFNLFLDRKMLIDNENEMLGYFDI